MTLGPASWCLLLHRDRESSGCGADGYSRRRSFPSGANIEDLAALGYVEEEYFIAAMAPTYALAPDSAYARDGRRSSERIQTVPFRTRIVVRRPVDSARFNGTVAVEWSNVPLAHDFMLTDITGLAASGFAFVGVLRRSGTRRRSTGRPALLRLPDQQLGVGLGLGPLRQHHRMSWPVNWNLATTSASMSIPSVALDVGTVHIGEDVDPILVGDPEHRECLLSRTAAGCWLPPTC